MSLLTLTHLSKAYGDNQVLANVTLTMHRGDKWGLVGANGVGKSTLIKIIVGEVEPDAGAIEIAAGVEIGYLPQVLAATESMTLEAMIARSQERVHAIEQQLRVTEALMAQGGDVAEALARYGQLGEEFERLGGYDLAHRTASVLAGLGVGEIAGDRTVASLSGGEKARVGLAALLLQAPDLLLLDEPTNHLDFAALTWLEGFLQSFDGALLVVSHDRTFLNRTVRAIVEIDEHSREAKLYAGNYDFFAHEKILARTRWVEEYDEQQEEIRELRRFIHSKARQVGHNRPGGGDKLAYNYKGGRVEATIGRNLRAAEERLRRIEANPIPKPPQPLRINPDFDPARLVNKTPIALSQVSVAYDDHRILDAVTVTLGAQDRIVVVGPNGAGKSTLLKVMAGRLAPDEGDVTVAASAAIGYLDQEQESLPADGTLYEAYAAGRIGEWEEIKGELMGYHLFTFPDLLKPVTKLSVGQKRKLQLALLMAARANVLLLDEPTNHISLDVLEEFEAALLDFRGAIIAISHDRRFIERFADQVWEMRDGRLVRYLGGWPEYIETL
ncbi:MAG: glycosyl transferase family 1 [Chloroflexota bacterium]|nr:MAG: glycosyl transferase family 1 [Chloroflexota bacterium]